MSGVPLDAVHFADLQSDRLLLQGRCVNILLTLLHVFSGHAELLLAISA